MSAWTRFLAGRSPHPIELPTVILLGCRPHTPSESFPDNPDCPVCGACVRETGTYCVGCERIADDDQAAIDHARRATPSPRPDPPPPPVSTDDDELQLKPPIQAEMRRIQAWWRAEKQRRALLSGKHLKGGLE